MSGLSKREILIGLGALPFGSDAHAQTNKFNFSEMKIYYMNWDIQTRMSIDSERMRNGYYDTFCHLKNNYKFGQKLLSILELDKLTTPKYPIYPNVRLIVDLVNPESTLTYVADSTALYSLDTNQFHPIDDTFRNFFRENFSNV